MEPGATKVITVSAIATTVGSFANTAEVTCVDSNGLDTVPPCTSTGDAEITASINGLDDRSCLGTCASPAGYTVQAK